MENWGPLFRISFDLIFKSRPTSEQDYNIVAFKGNGARSDCCNIGDRVPYLSYHPSETTERLTFASAVGVNGNWAYDHNITVEINKTYNIVIEQKTFDNEVCNFMSICVRRRPSYYIFYRFIFLHRLTGLRSSVSWTQPQNHFKMCKYSWEMTLLSKLTPPTATWCGWTQVWLFKIIDLQSSSSNEWTNDSPHHFWTQ